MRVDRHTDRLNAILCTREKVKMYPLIVVANVSKDWFTDSTMTDD